MSVGGSTAVARRSALAPLAVAAVLLSCTIVLLLGYLLKARCVGPQFDASGASMPNWGLRASRDLCYSELQQAWFSRGFGTHQFPYVHGALVDGQLVGGTVEYPVLTGLALWLAALPAHNDGQMLLCAALLLAATALTGAALLHRMAPRRAWVWYGSTGLLFSAYLQTDVLPAVATIAAFFVIGIGRPWIVTSLPRVLGAAAWLGVGGALKLYPLLFVLPLAIWAVTDRRLDAEPTLGGRWRRGATVVGVPAAVLLVTNLPFMLINFNGWWASFEFQWQRPIDMTTNSIWFWADRPHSNAGNTTVQHTLMQVSTTATAVALIVALVAGFVLSRRLGNYPWLQVSAAMLAGYLLLNKVNSPQYVLWLLPFFVLLRIHWGWIVGYLVADVCLQVGFLRWNYLLIAQRPANVWDSVWTQQVMIGVWGRAALLVCLFVVFLGSQAVPSAADGSGSGRQRHRSPPTSSGRQPILR